MTRVIYLSTLLCLLALQLRAQPFFPVTHTSGTRTIPGGINVKVTPSGSCRAAVYTDPACSFTCTYEVGTYYSGAFTYSFWPRVKTIRANMHGFNIDDTCMFFINGNKFNILSTHIVNGDCGQSPPLLANGDLYGVSGASLSGKILFSFSSSFDTLRILEPTGPGGVNGVAYDFACALPDTGVNVYEPFIDTVLCVGEIITVGYAGPYRFQSGNSFTVQLSEPNGSFNAFTILGTKNAADTLGFIQCAIPNTISPGTDYRLRIVSSSPYRISLPNDATISIGKKPDKPNATANTPVCEGHTLVLNTTAPNTPDITCRWFGPNGWNDYGQSVSRPGIDIVDSGLYFVEVSSYGCADSDTVAVMIKPGPGPVTASSNDPVCYLDTLKLRCTEARPNSTYAWTGTAVPFNSSKDLDIPGVFAGGKYIVTATLNNCTISDTVDIVVKQKPIVSAPKNNGPLCPGDTIVAEIATILGGTYKWTTPAGETFTTAKITIPAAKMQHAGKFYVEAALDGCKLRDSTALVIKPSPGKPEANSNSPLCAGDNMALTTGNITPGINYTWNGPANYYRVLANPSPTKATYEGEGFYILTANLNGCINSDTIFVEVNPVPFPTAASPDTVLCEGDTIRLSVSDTLAGINFSWSGPENFSSGDSEITITGTKSSRTGKYFVVSELDGCSNSDTVNMLVKQMPDTPVAGSNSVVCSGQELELTVAPVTAGAIIKWTGPDSFNSGLQHPVITNPSTTASGIYKVVIDLNGCYQQDTTPVLVKLTPDVTVLNNGPVPAGGSLEFKIPNHVPGTFYQWTGPDGFSSRVQNPIINPAKPTAAGRYTVTATLDGCEATAVINIIVNEVKDTGTYTLYPNPNNGTFTLSGLLRQDQKIKLHIFNALGQEIHSEFADVTDYTLRRKVILPYSSNGFYTLRFRADGKLVNIPFIIER